MTGRLSHAPETTVVRLPAHTALPTIFGVGFATGFAGAVMPGSLLAVVVRETTRVGWSAGPIMMIGHGVLELIAIVLLVTGLIAFARAPMVGAAIKLVGAAVLLYLAWQTFLTAGDAGVAAAEAVDPSREPGRGWLRLAALGMLMSMANPYWWLWWATIGVAHSAWAVQRGRIGAGVYYVGHVLSDVVWYSAVSIALGAGRSLLSPGVMRGIYVGCGVFLLALGVIFGVAGARTIRSGHAESMALGTM